jgi:hypothetical protein
MSALSTKEKRQLKDLIITLNSYNDLGFKYPIGNKELCEMVKEFESIGYIKYDDKNSKWGVK